MSSVSSGSSSSSNPKSENIDPVIRNALRYTVSAKEYKLLHRYLISRAPAVRKKTPPPPRYEAIVKSKDDYNAAAIRVSFRLFVSVYGALRGWEYLIGKLVKRTNTNKTKPRANPSSSPIIRLSGSLGLILLFHRLLHRFFLRLRDSLLTDEAKAFRRRNPRVARTLTSRLAPAIGASISGFLLAVSPSDQLRVTIAIYVFTKALEHLYNRLENKGWFQERPWWFGSWMIMPIACGQLLHAFIFDRDCFPEAYGGFILNRSPTYIQTRPQDYPSHIRWPESFEIVDGLAEMSKLHWPVFVSPILFPSKQTLPATLTSISPVTDSTHPAIKSLSCALLHPNDPSCIRTYITYWIQAFPPVTQFFTLVFAALSIPKYKSFLTAPMSSLNRLAKNILKMSVFLTGAIGSTWGSVCLFHNLLPRNVLPTQRWFFGGFIAGLWAFLERKSGRANFLYAARMSIDSMWKVGVKRGWWKGLKNGDVILFVLSLAVMNSVYEIDPKAVNSGVVRKSLGMLRGDGWVDRAAGAISKAQKSNDIPEETGNVQSNSGPPH
ncbi:hypothetical protein M501DRAFT_926160 [Patellaria atrata CBS 101060]|uniref:Transmembrane protein 135 N-terminal domain-containing protein n=1 Tax=Patellaria atrata CBS 101060 TaxID=1346257 RepID=A0A9P4SK42_9PEZI|nr:hypothetical protein M501DRAFT_926160 [Patellaria atrata CBS 101060]